MGAATAKPAVGRFRSTNGDRWLVILTSGYNNLNSTNVGRSIYALDAYTGQQLGAWNVVDVPAAASNPNIETTMPGGVTLVDADGDGYVDRFYTADTAGRLWKVNTVTPISGNSSTSMTETTAPICQVFDAGDPTNSGQRVWAPISMRPGVALIDAARPNIYFGTGGDDSVPATIQSKFYSVRDTDAMGACTNRKRTESSLSLADYEWVVGDQKQNTPGKEALAGSGSEGVPGDRYWAEPTIVNNSEIYFTSLAGPIDTVDPCSAAASTSKLFGYAARTYRDSLGVTHGTGQPLFSSKGFLTTSSTIRQGPVLVGANAIDLPVHRPSTISTVTTQSLLLQQTDGSVLRLGTTGSVGTRPLQKTGYREIPLERAVY